MSDKLVQAARRVVRWWTGPGQYARGGYLCEAVQALRAALPGEGKPVSDEVVCSKCGEPFWQPQPAAPAVTRERPETLEDRVENLEGEMLAHMKWHGEQDTPAAPAVTREEVETLRCLHRGCSEACRVCRILRSWLALEEGHSR
jgi:hypothetical protein